MYLNVMVESLFLPQRLCVNAQKQIVCSIVRVYGKLGTIVYLTMYIDIIKCVIKCSQM